MAAKILTDQEITDWENSGAKGIIYFCPTCDKGKVGTPVELDTVNRIFVCPIHGPIEPAWVAD